MINENELPKGWERQTLKDLTSILGDGLHGTPKYSSDGEYYFINGNNLTDGKIELKENTKRVSKSEFDKYKKNLTERTILISINGTIGNTAFYRNEKVILGKSACYFNVLNHIDKRFIRYCLTTNRFIKYTNEKATGSTIKNVGLKALREFEVPIPPLTEQERIVAKIEELFSELDAGLESLKTAQAQLKSYRQAVLKYAFEGKLTEEWRKCNQTKSAFEKLKGVAEKRKQEFDEAKKKGEKKPVKNYDFTFSESKEVAGWATATLDKLIYIAGRIGWRGLKKDEYKSEGPLFLSVHSLNYGKYVEFKDAFHVSKERYEESPEIMLQNDDILLCKDGAGIGKIGIIKNLLYEATVNSSLLVIRGLEIFVPEFLFYLLSGPKLQRLVQERITGSATPHLFQNDIRKFELLIPPIEEQQRIVEEIESRLSVCDKLEETINASLKQAEALRQSILKQAFEGKLIAQEKGETVTVPKEENNQMKLFV
ncbi:MAG TPA: restriction endonuclease subunit S [Pyrinomonadaceae bacterium]|nr:restriction endonuclease subunit S [Pyrinomonadaceae bacterium]